MIRHGETRVLCFIDMDDTSYGAVCLRHYTESGLRFGTSEQAKSWECPQCQAEAREYERATRDD